MPQPAAFTAEQIIQTAENLELSGRKATYIAVRTALGGHGSYATIGPVLKARSEQKAKEQGGPAPAANPVPEEIVTATMGNLVKTWSLASSAADATLAPEREALAQARISADEEAKQLKEFLGVVEGEKNEMEAAIQEKDGRLDKAHEALGTLKAELGAANDRLREAFTEIQATRAEAKDLYGANQRLNGQVQGLEAALAKAEEAHDATRADLMALKVEIGSLQAELNVAKAATQKS
jgi:DNA repair exonuclease SbcCD ATPase subunit